MHEFWLKREWTPIFEHHPFIGHHVMRAPKIGYAKICPFFGNLLACYKVCPDGALIGVDILELMF